MAHKKRNPAAVAPAGGAKGIAVSKNTASIAQTGGKANSPAITSIRRGPRGWAEWLVSIRGVCTAMPQAAWSAIIEAAIAKGGAS
jgi:hypothetical protein